MDFLGLSHITFAPGYTTETHPSGLASFTDEDWIDAFYRSYSFWVLRYAEFLTHDPNAGFAILQLMYPYFQMIARYKNGEAKEKHDRDEFKQGFYTVFEIDMDRLGASFAVREQVSDWLYRNMRCELAHGNLTGEGVALSDDGTESIWWAVDSNGKVNGVGVNPRKWVERISQHFEEYRKQLLDNGEERENFLKYAKRYLPK